MLIRRWKQIRSVWSRVIRYVSVTTSIYVEQSSFLLHLDIHISL